MESLYEFDMPVNIKSIIKVLGVGGGGSNAVSYMYSLGIKDVEFVVCNTDLQALNATHVNNKLQIGKNLTSGLGAGANPEVGKKAAEESKKEIRDMLVDNTRMLFITAGMGGGTGTGAAPVIARIAKELDILTVGIVTVPFSFEGKKKNNAALKGVQQMKENCDTVLVINNDKLREIYGNLSIRDAFAKADNILNTAAKSIAEVITVTSEVNVDFEDVKTVMKDSGPAVMGSAATAGENRARRAVEEALSSPLLDNKDITGARKILLSISYGELNELTMDELTDITDYIEEQAGEDAEVIFGQGLDKELEDQVRVTIIATGFEASEDQIDDYFSKKVIDLNSPTSQTLHYTQTPMPRPEPRPELKSKEIIPEDYATPPAQPAAPAPEEVKEKPALEIEKTYFHLDGEYEVTEITPQEQTYVGVKEEDAPLPDEVELKKRRLMEQSKKRIARIKEFQEGKNLMNMSEIEDFNEKLKVPAYKRKNVKLSSTPHSSESQVSRYNLNDGEDGLGKNRFLHDNVD